MKRGILYGVFFGVITAGGFTVDNRFTAPGDGIVAGKTGGFEVYMLVENRGRGRPSILIGADEALRKQYLPGGSYESETNTFLVRGQGRIIVADTGFGGAIFDRMKTLGIDPGDVDAVLLAHMHGDHIGGLQRDGKPLSPKAAVYLARRRILEYAASNSIPVAGMHLACPAAGTVKANDNPADRAYRFEPVF